MRRLFFLLLLLTSCSEIFASVIYVSKDANGANDGTSWTNAFTDLGTAINAAAAGDDLRITVGTYTYHNLSYTIDENITITGGFDGSELGATPNNPIANFNINDFGSGTRINGEGAQAFLTIDGTTANGSISNATRIQNIVFLSNGFKQYGIEVLGDNTTQTTDPVIKDCIFWSFTRSAISMDGTNGNLGVNIENCTFRFNGNTTNPSGAAITVNASNSSSTVTIRNSTFSDNEANDAGGAIYSSGCDNLYILDSKFTENEVDNNGGVLFIFDFQFLGIANSEFSENNAGGTGGCIYMQGADLNANATILDCTFSQNTANSFGGVFYNFYVNTKINRCKFYNNTAPSGGGAFLQANAGGSVQNSVFKDNSGGSTGNATYSFYDESDAISQPFTLAFTNCSFSENDNANNGGTTCYMNHSGTGSVNTFENCILWNNGTSEILTAGDATATLNYSILDDGNNNGIVLLPNNVSGSNNLDIDPLFTDNSLTIACESPAVDMGSDATNVGGIDIAGNDRNISLYATGQTRDIGAFEVQSRAVCDCNSEGMICDDMNANTYNDTLNAACECVGIPISNGCIAGEMEEFSGAPGDLNLRFTTVNSLSCTSGTLTGEAHITYRQYLMDDWFTFEGLACNETSPIKIRRPKRLREPAAVSRNRYDYCFMETWEMENETCVSDILTISVYVYSDETFATDLTLNQATIPSDLYIASNQISAQGGVATNDTVNLVAGNAIVLSPGFVVNSGATFSARISAIPSCNTSQRIAPAVPNEPILTTTKVPQSPTLAVYPNPANIEITIAYQLPELSTINVGLYSLNGQLLETISSNQVAQRGDHFINLNVADYPKGIYFISLRTEQYQEIRKIVVQ